MISITIFLKMYKFLVKIGKKMASWKDNGQFLQMHFS